MFNVPSTLINQTKPDSCFPFHSMMSHQARGVHAPQQIVCLLLQKPDEGWLRCGNALHRPQGWAQVLTQAMMHLFYLGLIERDLETAFKHLEDLLCVLSFRLLMHLMQMQT
jgi:hypothetical protein